MELNTENLVRTAQIEHFINSKGWSTDIRQEAIDLIAGEEVPDEQPTEIFLTANGRRSVTYIKRGKLYIITNTKNIPL